VTVAPQHNTSAVTLVTMQSPWENTKGTARHPHHQAEVGSSSHLSHHDCQNYAYVRTRVNYLTLNARTRIRTTTGNKETKETAPSSRPERPSNIHGLATHAGGRS
jgi:hypothetical protein